jgi:hypothetical protein
MARTAAFLKSYDADRKQQDQEPIEQGRPRFGFGVRGDAVGNLTAQAPASRASRRLATLAVGRLSALSLCEQSGSTRQCRERGVKSLTEVAKYMGPFALTAEMGESVPFSRGFTTSATLDLGSSALTPSAFHKLARHRLHPQEFNEIGFLSPGEIQLPADGSD